jgi:hypothetical protein
MQQPLIHSQRGAPLTFNDLGACVQRASAWVCISHADGSSPAPSPRVWHDRRRLPTRVWRRCQLLHGVTVQQWCAFLQATRASCGSH